MKFPLLGQGTVMQWLFGDLSFMSNKSRETEKRWLREIMRLFFPGFEGSARTNFAHEFCHELLDFSHNKNDNKIYWLGNAMYHYDSSKEDALEDLLSLGIQNRHLSAKVGRHVKILCMGGADVIPYIYLSNQTQALIKFYAEEYRLEFVSASEYVRRTAWRQGESIPRSIPLASIKSNESLETLASLDA